MERRRMGMVVLRWFLVLPLGYELDLPTFVLVELIYIEHHQMGKVVGQWCLDQLQGC